MNDKVGGKLVGLLSLKGHDQWQKLLYKWKNNFDFAGSKRMTGITPSERIAVSSVRQMTDEQSEPSQPAVGCLYCH